ncbi:signal peptidase II [Nonomuraea typhae]|uniref:signal peptidase II n=1 Tax=Nonomuraea typhae TaxID=2603600 RepID=UPI001CA584CB|nr:signal peptidase II [Nonomuraea typhae]
MTEHEAGPTRRRASLIVLAALLSVLLVAAKIAADQLLPGRIIEVGLIQLRLLYNPGVAFGLGADLPTWTRLAVPAAITVGIGVYGWRRSAAAAGRIELGCLTVMLAGALANVIDRLPDGVVTDYLHTGWWPTFNLPDTFIVVGALVFAFTARRSDSPDRAEAERRD